MAESKRVKTETQELDSKEVASQIAKAVIHFIKKGEKICGFGSIPVEELRSFKVKKNKKFPCINLVDMKEARLEEALKNEYDSMSRKEKTLFRKGVSELGYFVRKAESSFRSMFRHCDNMHSTVQNLKKEARRYGYRV